MKATGIGYTIYSKDPLLSESNEKNFLFGFKLVTRITTLAQNFFDEFEVRFRPNSSIAIMSIIDVAVLK